MKIINLFAGVTALMMLTATVAQAQEPAETKVTLLTIHLTDGDKEQYNLPDKPVITFNDADMIVKSGSVETTYQRADVEYFNFEQGSPVTGIETIETENFTFTYIDNNEVEIHSPEIKWVKAYDVNARLAATAEVSGAVAKLKLGHLPSGVYFVVCSTGKTIKIIKQ